MKIKRESITEIKAKLFAEEFSEMELVSLKKDDRKGVKRLIEQYDRQCAEKLKLKAQFKEMMQYEQEQYHLGKQYIAGIDEAGRGPLAGPVVAAAVILSKDFYLEGLNDSKKIPEKKRNLFFEYIQTHAISYGVGIVDSQTIDEINIYQATKLAMREAIEQLNPEPEHVLIDAVKLDGLRGTSEAITKGDQKSVTIAAASIIAKVTRDRLMLEMHDKHPEYKFDSNMGYGTKDHLEAIQKFGVTAYHRKTFAPISRTESR